MRKKRVVVIICLLLVVAIAAVIAWQFLHVDSPAVGDGLEDDNQSDVVDPVPVVPHEHSWGEWIVKTLPTCVDMGQEQRVCDCGEIQCRDIAALGHSFGEWGLLVHSTCVDGGYEQRDCLSCGQSEMREVPALGHDFVDGYCSRCGDVDSNYDFSCKHENTSGLILDPTCTEDGSVNVSCSDCGELISSEITPALGHDFVDGYCSRCGEIDPDYAYDMRLTASVGSAPDSFVCMSLDATDAGSVLFASSSEEVYVLTLTCSDDLGKTLTLGSLNVFRASDCAFGVDRIFGYEFTEGVEYHFQVVFTAYSDSTITYVSNFVDIVWNSSFYNFTASM